MSTDDGTVQIRSYRVCFQLEHRLHRIDRWRLPVPYGVPLRGIVYGAVGLLAVALLDRLPVFSQALNMLPIGARYLVLPLGGAYLLAQYKLDGRCAHVAAKALLRHRLSPTRVCGFQPRRPPEPVRFGSVTAAAGEHDPGSRRAIITGPATVVMRHPARFRTRGRTLHAHRLPGPPLGQGKQVNLGADQKVVVL